PFSGRGRPGSGLLKRSRSGRDGFKRGRTTLPVPSGQGRVLSRGLSEDLREDPPLAPAGRRDAEEIGERGGDVGGLRLLWTPAGLEQGRPEEQDGDPGVVGPRGPVRSHGRELREDPAVLREDKQVSAQLG